MDAAITKRIARSVAYGNVGGREVDKSSGFRPPIDGSTSFRRDGGVMSLSVRICNSVYQLIEQVQVVGCVLCISARGVAVPVERHEEKRDIGRSIGCLAHEPDEMACEDGYDLRRIVREPEFPEGYRAECLRYGEDVRLASKQEYRAWQGVALCEFGELLGNAACPRIASSGGVCPVDYGDKKSITHEHNGSQKPGGVEDKRVVFVWERDAHRLIAQRTTRERGNVCGVIQAAESRLDAARDFLVDERCKHDNRSALCLLAVRVTRFVSVQDRADDAFVDENVVGWRSPTPLERRRDEAFAECKGSLLLKIFGAHRGFLPRRIHRNEKASRAPAACGACEHRRALADKRLTECLERA